MADLQGRELDAAVAERVMGTATHVDSYGNLVYWANKGRRPKDLDSDRYTVVPYYSLDWAAVTAIRAEIERRGLVWEFMVALNNLTAEKWEGMTVEIQWRAMNATPEQQCRAALAAVMEEK